MKLLIYILVILALCSSSFASAEEEVGITAVVIKGGSGDVPKVCYYDPKKAAAHSGDWNDGLLGCDPALIGKASTPTPTSPPEGFGVLFHHVETKGTGYTCPDFAQVTEEGVGIHCMIGTKERQRALRHPTPENTRVTHGCINVPTDGLFRRYSARINLVHIVD